MMATDKTEAAFEKYLSDPVVIKVRAKLEAAHEGSLTYSFLKDCFMHGAKYATDRCKKEHHQPKKSGA